MRNPLRLNWDKVEGKVVDRNLVKRLDRGSEQYGAFVVRVVDFMVEVPGPDGQPKRLIVRETEHKLRLPEDGNPVPLLVNKSRTKAAFDRDGTEIDAVGRARRHEKTQKQNRKKREQKFREKL